MASLSPGEEDMESASEGEGGWSEVRKKTSRKKIDMSSDSLSESDSRNELKRVKKKNENEDWKVIVEFGEQTAAKLHPVALTKAIHKEIGSIKQARFLSKGRMLIELMNAKQQEKLLKMKTLNEVRIKCHVPGANRKILGVISGVPIEIGIEELKKEIKGGKVSVVKRLPTRYQGKIVDSLSVLLQFEETIQQKIMIGCMSFPVREFIPKLLRCFKCQRFGHVADKCKATKPRCPTCAGEHEYGSCAAGAKVKCCNCGGEHSAAYQGCEVQKKAKEVQRFKVQNKVSYATNKKEVKTENNSGSSR
ncbi:uncharacterized protein LOC117542404 [Gymnodraco acuticeps]|uniref:Uncharacterized protein LOC117542404 n=1 Tax=Gymnodraco acuticeps TaxID=8218 RepID=A0A6P8UIH3_GYMAC|nr:uncharacterized protein LOC117542404 [Gymnodraco acuticeps]